MGFRILPQDCYLHFLIAKRSKKNKKCSIVKKYLHVRAKAAHVRERKKSCYIIERTLKINFSSGGKLKVWKTFFFKETSTSLFYRNM